MNADLTFPAVCKGVVNVYVNAFGEHVIPREVISEAARLSGSKSISDKRTRGYRLIRKWMDQIDVESEAAWLRGAA